MVDKLVSFVNYMREGLKNNFDFFLTVDGPEGSGKSAFAMHMKAIYDNCYNLDHVLYDSQDLVETLKSAPRRSFVILDEAITSFLNRMALDRFQIRLIQALSIVRDRELIFVLILPNYFVLDPVLRVRSRYRFWVYAKKWERGFVKAYVSKRTEWTENKPYLEHRWSYIFPALPEEVKEMYLAFKRREMDRKLTQYQAEADAEERRKTEDAHRVRGTKMRLVLDALKKDSTRDVEDIALDVGCTVGYVSEIRRSLVKVEGKDAAAGSKGEASAED